MEKQGNFINLHYHDGSFCILRADRIVEIKSNKKGSKITYDNGMKFEVKEDPVTVRLMKDEASGGMNE